jgi:hypothetical protein
MKHDILGREQALTGFRHELIGKFLAARHLRHVIERGSAASNVVDCITLSGDELWLDSFYFVIDEISPRLLNRLLSEILTAGGSIRLRVAAYALGTKSSVPDEAVRSAYAQAKLADDLALTPASMILSSASAD